mmetsp:Transcript_37646/g.82646  ORF Transcript_37646/g.82646 Transcript_37646/m.82646 type:complete len:449 (-) Transcript_37646:110-1456(-)
MISTVTMSAASEFVGAFFIMAVLSCNLAAASVFAATSVACAYMVATYAVVDISGAHFNPAVTMALALTKNFEWSKVPVYIASQCAGASVAGFFCHLIYPPSQYPVAILFTRSYVGLRNAAVAEALYTGMLVLVFLCVTKTKKCQPNQYYGLAISFVLVAGSAAVGRISQAIFNPAISVGIWTSTFGNSPSTFSYLLVGQFSGVFLGIAMHYLTYPEEYDREKGRLSSFIAEFLGTFYVAVTFALSAIGAEPLGHWSIAAACMCMYYAMLNSSGAQFNPAVTLSLLMTGTFVDAWPLYMVAQMLGGAIGARVGVSISIVEPEDVRLPTPEFGIEIAMAEVLFTMVVCFVFLSITAKGNLMKEMGGLAVGSCITGGGFAIASVSGGCLNPAMAVGLYVVLRHSMWSLSTMGSYIGFQFLGAVLASIFFVALIPDTDPEESTEATSLLKTP